MSFISELNTLRFNINESEKNSTPKKLLLSIISKKDKITDELTKNLDLKPFGAF